MKNIFSVLLIGSVIWILTYVINKITDINPAAEEIVNNLKTDSLYVLNKQNINVLLSEQWEFIDVSSEYIKVFKKKCKDNVKFCPTISIYRIKDDSLNVNNYTLGQLMLKNLENQFEKVNIISGYDIGGNLNFYCFDFDIFNKNHDFGSTIAVLKEDSGALIISFTALDEPKNNYYSEKVEFLEIIKLNLNRVN